MSNLVLGVYNCEPNRVDKSNYIIWDDDVMDVDILANGTEEDSYNILLNMTMEEVRPYNYCKIDGKEYFLELNQAMDGGMCLVTANADYLHQDRERIYNSVQLVERNAKHVNAYLHDSMIPNASYDTINCIEFPNAINDDCIILMTVG